MGGRGSSFGGGGGGGYHQFTDKASDAFEYEGDGAEAVKFFEENSNFSQLMDSMSSEERNDFRSWASGSFMYGQQHKGWDSMTSWEQDQTLTYDKYLDQATLKQGITVSRLSDAQLVLGSGNKIGSLSDYQAMEGRLVTSKGSMSCGAAAEGWPLAAEAARQLHTRYTSQPVRVPGCG